ncbi:MAG TPA: S8 family serine peptidase [Pyrinomonadaceae bacterium]
MNRNNIWIHIGIAVVIVTLAAVLGQIRRWETSLRTAKSDSGISIAEKDRDRRDEVVAEPEILVRFKPGVSVDEIRRIAARHNDLMEDEIESVKGLVSIDDLDNLNAEDTARQYAAMSDLVEYAQPNYEIRLDPPSVPRATKDLLFRQSSGRPNDPQFGQQWALNNVGQDGGKERADIDALKAWLTTQGSEKIVVAVLDTGVDYTHKDLVANMWFRPDNIPQYADDELGSFDDVQGFDANANAPDPMDDNGHGTHCAGIIGAEGDNNEGIAGVNWNVTIMPLKFLGRGGFGSTKNAIEAINYAIDRKQKGVNVRVINASWGSTQYSRALEDAIRAAGEQGILFVAAAGNSSTDNDKRAHYPSNYNLPNVISVAALDRTDSMASFSNFGAKTVHIAAPGREILSTWLNHVYREASGTSMAAPQVSGVAALILANEPNLTVDKLRERLLRSVDKIPSLEGKVASGGRLNAAKALGK